MQAECSSVGECGIITENTAQGETTLAKKKPLKKDRKAGRGNLPAQKQPFYLQAQQQLIFNTVPAPILGKEQLQLLSGDCLLIDLASGAGGIDHPAARSLGLRCLHALALPAKTAPVTAGNILCDTVIQMITDLQSKTR